MEQPKLLDVVALLHSLPLSALDLTDEQYELSSGLAAGTVGTIVEVLRQRTTQPVFLVEFSDSQGRGYAFATVSAQDLLVLHYTPTEPLSAHQ